MSKVLLEGDSSSVEIHVKPSDFTSQRPNLNDFKQILKQQFEALKDVRPGNIDFISYKDRTQALFGDVLLANFHTTASCPLVVRYPLSTSSSNHEENLDIKNEFQFNKLVNQIEEKKETRVLPDLKVQIKAQLYVEANLYGSKGYGPVDYLVKLDDFAVLVNKAKLEDIHKGIAQNIMQLHSASESSPNYRCIFLEFIGKRKLEQTEFESSQQQLFGIVTTGVCWFFIRWTGSPENPKLKSLNNIIVILQGRWRVKKKYIVRILENQNDMLKNNSKRARR
ncbi:hypothetical protein C2G38_2039207 [Gigaspora rosea]|uniref:Uncharacterized protein n=1 Tax=Gigaspora rosea TaxID=44941 RepID=A0A397V6N9_9GLOM|nr:hypothetical protein C2G38_2039207 [Gigaspora rosea]